jgi:uncharacterized protein
VSRPVFYFLAIAVLASASASAAAPAFAQNSEVRRTYIFDNAGVISSSQEEVIHSYLRGLDRATTNEIVIYTIPSFEGHGIEKDGVEIQDRDMLANYIYNNVELDGIKGIGKADKDNGVLVLMSLERDAGGGSLRIEVGRGLEGDITDGTAGGILDDYLVPARQEYEETGSTAAFDDAFLGTVAKLGERTGYVADDITVPEPVAAPADDEFDTLSLVIFFGVFIAVAVLSAKYGRRGRRHGGYWVGGGGFGGGGRGGGGGGGFGGGGGGSGGGGAGR